MEKEDTLYVHTAKESNFYEDAIYIEARTTYSNIQGHFTKEEAMRLFGIESIE